MSSMSGFEEQDKLLGNVGAKKGDGEAQGKGNAVNATGRLRRRWQDELSTRQQRPHEEPDERGSRRHHLSRAEAASAPGFYVELPLFLVKTWAFLRNKKVIRRARLALSTILAVFAGIFLAFTIAGYFDMWNWRDAVIIGALPSNVLGNCRRVRSGREVPCGSPWTAPCFDRSRCHLVDPDGDGNSNRLSIYVHDDLCSMRSSLEIVKNYNHLAMPKMWTELAVVFRQESVKRGVLVETPEEACIVVYAVPRYGECVSRTPSWKRGQNHLLLDTQDEGREARQTTDIMAMFAETNMQPCYYRHGYDIALPLRAKRLFHEMRKVPFTDRKYFATFKGSLYLSGNGHLERTALLNLGQRSGDDDVVVVEKCHPVLKEHLLSWNVEPCKRLHKEYDAYDFSDLMNTTFALLPAGRSPATHRLAESLSAGAIPVFIVRDYVKPFPDRIPWKDFSFTFTAEEANDILETLRAVPEKRLAKMQATALEIFDTNFGHGMDGTVRTTLDILEERISFRG